MEQEKWDRRFELITFHVYLNPPLDSNISQSLMAPPCGNGRGWLRAVRMTFYLFILIPMSSTGNRNSNTIFGEKQKLEVQLQLKRLNKPALKSIKVINHFI